ncbi:MULTISPECIES: efflux RND transporter permease subunit [Providencia]|uniref:Efflux RND transporter permease subunit n=1 Tax=Providencia huaxiensis TaxID=2027290 RepID=A0ABU2ISC3_9GAMM|nr:MULTISPECIES: efflux RND transporter permease subunit [Providencia]MBZ3680901.1 efflux RND transporter permease subunit [Providencia rettgeri]AXH63254.1 efflux RND transporter permease subunit [Providencia huaxiensis]MDT0131940.1 efflux RND transporter permease subunit [Providencia huaxiensis]MDT1978346.1 efflux RND transporter permease subunit [Providencia huaxiensis]QLR01485.1 efflux RND transporter permease subunit [Providencia rettgeri]
MKLQLSSWAITRPIPTIVIFLALTIAGLFSFNQLPITANPVITFPIVTVTVTQDGSSPTELENAVTKRVERAVSGIPGIRHITSSISEGASTTTIEFDLSVDAHVATNDVREQIGQIRGELPQTIDEPLINRIDVEGGAILRYAVSSETESIADLSWFVDDTVSKQLITVPGVQKVSRLGDTERVIRIEPDADKLAAMQLSIASINEILKNNHQNSAGGNAKYNRLQHTIRVLGEKQAVDDIKNIMLPIDNQKSVRLGEIANIYDGHKNVKSISQLDGKEVVGFAVYRAKGSSDTKVAQGVVQALEKLQKANPNVEISLVSSTVKYTESSFTLTIQTLLEGAFLTIVIVFFFLKSWRATLVAAVALPLSILPTFFILMLFDYSLNSITLLALTLVIGILVDDAIVEIENIQKYIERGERPYLAALKASDAIGFAIVAITLTIVAVFLPVSFIGGFVGQYFVPFGITVSAAVLSSLLVARLVTPLMAAYVLLPQKGAHEGVKTANWIARYTRFLSMTLKHRKFASMLAGGFLFGSVAITSFLPVGFMPDGDISVSQINIELPPGTPVEQTQKKINEIAKQLKDRPEILSAYSIAGIADDSEGVAQHKGEMILTLTEPSERELSQKEFELAISEWLSQKTDARYTFSNSNGGKEFSLMFTGSDPEQLEKSMQKLREAMAKIDGFKNVQVMKPLLRKELIVKPNVVDVARTGISVEEIANTLRIATMGEANSRSAKFNLPDRQLAVQVILPESQQNNIDVLNNLYVRSQNGQNVPIKSVANIDSSDGPSQIERINRQRQMSIEANLEGLTLGEALDIVAQLPEYQQLPHSISQVEYGDMEYMIDMFERFGTTMVFSVLLVFAILIVLFKDFIQPITILVALPFSIGGAIIALVLYGAMIDLPVIIGILMLMGIVTKNSILLVEFILEKQRSGMAREKAIIEAGQERIRPIIMTTFAMIAGMIPLVLTSGADAGFRAPMAIAVIGGLLSSTILSLLFVPVIYSLMDDLKRKLLPQLAKLTSVTKEDRNIKHW